MEFIKPNEAKQRLNSVEENIEVKYATELKNINDRITKESLNSTCIFIDHISSQVIRYLEKLGYKVQYEGNQREGDLYLISW